MSEHSRCIIRTNVRGAVRGGQVGAGLPGLGFESSLTGRTVLSSGVVLAVTLKGPITEGALTGVEVTLTPVKTPISTLVTSQPQASIAAPPRTVSTFYLLGSSEVAH